MIQIPQPPRNEWHVAYACRICGAQPVATVDLYSGKRCADHPPEHDPTVPVELAIHGLPSAAEAYNRNDWPQEAA